MKNIKRIIAIILSVLFTVSTGVEPVLAAEMPKNTETEVEKAVTENNTEESNISVLLEYVVVELPKISIGQKQRIAVGLSEKADLFEEIRLQLINTDTNTVIESKASKSVDKAVLFEFDFSDEASAGQYSVNKLTYRVNGKDTEVLFNETGMKASFGVGKSVKTSPDAIVEDADGITPEILEVEGNNNSVIAKYKSNGTYTVVIDPGHGGTGGTGHAYGNEAYNEAQIVLDIAKYCRDYLKNNSNFNVYMTRETDNENPGLEARLEYAQSVGADFLISIHINSGGGTGAEIWIPSENYNKTVHDNAKIAGDEIMKNLVALGMYNRGSAKVRLCTDNSRYPDGSLTDYYAINRHGKIRGIPAIIVEHGFLDREADFNNFLKTQEQRRALGEADAKAVIKALPKFSGLYSLVYDEEYYLAHNGDVKAVYGNDSNMVFRHFINCGMAEGRRASESFDVNSYRMQYPDLRNAYGSDLKAYYMHYINYGYAEGRQGTGCTKLVGAITRYNGVDYSAVYDYEYYSAHNGDVYSYYKGDENKILAHFVNYGMSEGRRAKESFDVVSYRNANPDLRRAYGKDLRAYYMHYVKWGQREGRVATGQPRLLNGTTIYNGIDYASVYNYDYYTSNNRDVYNAYKGDEDEVLAHFVRYGMSEGRQAKADFDVRSYRNLYLDLRRAYGTDLKSYYMHYVKWGKTEGRKAVGQLTIVNPRTDYNGIDYSAVYNLEYYLSVNRDVYAAYGRDEDAVIAHFVNYGMKEGRVATSSFNVWSYKAKNNDLQVAYGNNIAAYYLHYINYGKREGRLTA